MAIERVTDEQVRPYSNSKLVGDFEVACQQLNDGTIAEGEIRHKNLNVLRREIYRRMGDT